MGQIHEADIVEARLCRLVAGTGRYALPSAFFDARQEIGTLRGGWLVLLQSAPDEEIIEFIRGHFVGRQTRLTEREWLCSRLEDAVMLSLRFP